MAEGYLNIDKQTLDLIKYPPLKSPVVAYGEDADYSSNNLRGKQFQFCYRYKYDNKMKSVFSPYSEVPIPQGEELPNGDFIPNFRLNNMIKVQVEFGHHTADEIEVAYREGNNGTLYVYDRIKNMLPISNSLTGRIYPNGPDMRKMDKIGDNGGLTVDQLKEGMIISIDDSGLPYHIDGYSIVSIDTANKAITLNADPVYDVHVPWYDITTARIDMLFAISVFRHDKVDYAVSETERDESFDKVPIKSGSMEVVESNRIVLGDNITGFPNLPINVELALSNQVVAEYVIKSVLAQNFINDVSGVREVLIRIPDTLTDGDYLYMNFKFISRIDGSEHIKTIGYFYQSSDPKTPEQITTYFIDALNTINNIAEVATDPTLDYNFRARTLLQDSTQYPIPTYSASGSYNTGAIVKHNTRVFVASRATTGTNPPSSNTNNGSWDYLCPVSEMDRVIMVRALPLGSTGTFYNYFLDIYGATIYNSKAIYPIFKFGHKQNFALEYFDYAGRLGSAQKGEGSEIYVPRENEVGARHPYNNSTNSISLTIKHQPPDWAYGYRVLVDRNMPWFQQFYVKGPGNTNPDVTDDNIHIKINVNRAIQNLRKYFPKSILSPYLFQKKDRIRILAYQKAVDVDNVLNRWHNYIEVIDSEIIGYDYPLESETYMKDDKDDYVLDEKGNKVREESTGTIIVEKGSLDFDTIKDAVYLVYEIYRPRKTSDENTSYWETAKTFLIGNPTSEDRVHLGDTDQTPFVDNVSATPATILLSMGNCYRKMRYSGDADVYFPVESMHSSDYYPSDSISIGRANAISQDLGQVREENIVMYSGKVLEGTGVNQLNKFPIGNRIDKLQSKYGRVTGFKEKSYILYAFQERKVTSMYVGMSSMIDPSDGSDNMKILSGAVFGTIRPQTQEYGCINPESISMSSNHVFFWDSINGKWCRVAYNGVFPISEYGANGIFNEISEGEKASGLKVALSVWDNKHDELIVTHKYQFPTDYNLTVVGQYVIGDNKITGVGRNGGNLIGLISEGMLLTGLSTSEEITNQNLTLVVLKVDTDNRIIYVDQPIPFAEDAVGPFEVTASIIKKIKLQTLSFHEGVNGWKSRYSFFHDYAITFGDELLSFINGRTYIHDSDNVPYNNFYGIQFESYIQFPWNLEPSMVKLFEGIEKIATHRWGMIAKGDVTIKSFDNRGIDMESMLPAARFRNVEGKFVSELLRDMNTPNSGIPMYTLVNGRFLRGQACILKMTTFETGKTVLYEVSLYFTPSL